MQRLDIAYERIEKLEQMTSQEDVKVVFDDLMARINNLEKRAKKIDSNIRKMMKLLAGD